MAAFVIFLWAQKKNSFYQNRLYQMQSYTNVTKYFIYLEIFNG